MTASDDPDWPILESRTEYETSWYDGGYDLVEQPDGTEKRYYWAELPDAVVVVARIDGTALEAAVDDDPADGSAGDRDDDPTDRILFVEQYRPAVRETHLELPAGIVEERDDPTGAGARGRRPGDAASEAAYVAAAERELEEETGFRPSSATLLQTYAVATGVLRHRRAIVYAEGLVPGERDLDGNEFLEVRAVPVDEALARAREPPTNDATLSGLLLASEEGLV